MGLLTPSSTTAEPPSKSSAAISTKDRLLSLSLSNPLLTSTSTVLLSLSSYLIYKKAFKRIPNTLSLTPGNLGGKSLRGVVTSVGDADNFRLYHTPFLRRASSIPTGKGLKDQTIHVRLAGVDAPELAHFGKPAQPYSAEAIDWLTKYILNRKLTVKLYQIDRYGRVVGMAYIRKFPYFPPFGLKNVSAEMLKVGLATVYTLGGAVHAGLLAEFERLEKKAQAEKKGMWKMNTKEYESPGEYKKRTGGGSD